MVLINPIVRLSQPVIEVFPQGLTPLQAAVALLWTGFMLYTEGWRGFHLQFAPRVVRRAWALADDPGLVRVVLAPAMCMGLIYANRKRLIVSWSLVTMIVVLVVAVRQLPQPWRAIVDLGVVLGLTAGLASVLFHWVVAVRGSVPDVAADLPESVSRTVP